MDLTTQAYLAAGLGALALGAAALLREPGRARARLFGALCLTLATWSLCSAASYAGLPGRKAFRALSFVGACGAAPVALHLVLVVVRRTHEARRMLLRAYAAGAVATVLAWLLRDQSSALRVAAMGIPMLTMLWLAGRELKRHGSTEEGRASRRSMRMLMGLSLAAALIALTDLIPRGGTDIPPLGPLALLPALFALATVGLQRRYLDLPAPCDRRRRPEH